MLILLIVLQEVVRKDVRIPVLLLEVLLHGALEELLGLWVAIAREAMWTLIRPVFPVVSLQTNAWPIVPSCKRIGLQWGNLPFSQEQKQCHRIFVVLTKLSMVKTNPKLIKFFVLIFLIFILLSQNFLQDLVSSQLLLHQLISDIVCWQALANTQCCLVNRWQLISQLLQLIIAVVKTVDCGKCL